MAKLQGIHLLTETQIYESREKKKLRDGGGLWLYISGKTGRRWVFIAELDGRKKEMGLGSLKRVPPKRARKLANEYRELMGEGIFPPDWLEEQKEIQQKLEAEQVLFRDAAEQCLTERRNEWTAAKSEQRWESIMRLYVLPVIGDVPVSKIDTRHVLRMAKPHWDTKPHEAKRAIGQVRTVLAWSRVNGLRQGDNPADWKGNLDKALSSPNKVRPVRSHASLPYGEIPELAKALREHTLISSKCLLFIILTASRSKEALTATWDQFDIDKALWTVPADQMKSRREHKVPLSAPALEILDYQSRFRSPRWVFPGEPETKHVSSTALSNRLRRLEVPREQATVHGFRSSFRTWAEECSNAKQLTMEMCLAHYPSDEVLKAYNRAELLESRAKLLCNWASFCLSGRNEG